MGMPFSSPRSLSSVKGWFGGCSFSAAQMVSAWMAMKSLLMTCPEIGVVSCVFLDYAAAFCPGDFLEDVFASVFIAVLDSNFDGFVAHVGSPLRLW